MSTAEHPQSIGGEPPPADSPLSEERDDLLRASATSRVGWPIFFLFWAGWMALLTFTWTTHPGLSHGDPFSDAYILVAGRNFDRHGLSYNWGLPQGFTYTEQPVPNPPYFTFPPGEVWLLQSFKAMGLSELWQFRAAVLVFAAVAGLLLMALVTRLTQNSLIGALAVIFYMGSAPFFEYADSLCYHTYSQVTLFATLLAWTGYERAESGARRKWLLLLACLLFFLDGWLTLEHMPFVAVFAFVRTLQLRPRRLGLGLILIVFVPVLVVGTRLAHATIALGSWQEVTTHLKEKAEERTGQAANPASYRELAEAWRRRLHGESIGVDHYDYRLRYPLLRKGVIIPAAILGVILLTLWQAHAMVPMRRAAALSLLLAVCGMVWLLIFAQHAIIHRHLILLLMPAAAVGLACLAATGLQVPWAIQSRYAPIRFAGPAIALFMICYFLNSLTRSCALNHVADLNHRVRRYVAELEDANARLEAFAGGLTDVRFVAIRSTYPELSCLLGKYFLFTDADQLPEVGPDGLYWLQIWGEEDKLGVLRVVERYGWPSMFSPRRPFLAPHMVFRGSRTLRRNADAVFEGGLRLTGINVAETLDGDDWLIQALIEASPSQLRDPSCVVYFHLVDPAGNKLVELNMPLSAGAHSKKTGFVWTFVPRVDVPAGTRIRAGVWRRDRDTDGGRTLAVQGNPASLPYDGNVCTDKSCIEFVPSAWIAGPASPVVDSPGVPQ